MGETQKKIAVVLSGCGYLDGAEIRESVLTLLYLDQNNVDVKIFAPDIDQHHVINHLTGEEQNESRNVLTESARIARGKVEALTNLKAGDFDAIIMPGGYGVAKNLSDLAFKGAEASVNADLKSILAEFQHQHKPIGLICIAPAVGAAALGDISVTIGDDPDTAQAIQAMGGNHTICATSEIFIDETHNVISTSAYMREDKLSDVAEGIEKLVAKIVSMA